MHDDTMTAPSFAEKERLVQIYGTEIANAMLNDKRGNKFRNDLRDRSAYVYVTGQFPSHLRPAFTGVLRAITSHFRRPVALDGRSGHLKLDEKVVEDLDLNNHPMVVVVRDYISRGFKIQPSLGMNTRRGFGKVFMFKVAPDTQLPVNRMTVMNNGAVASGWPDR